METEQIKFSGFADIYLQGYDALQPLESGPEHMIYYVGCAVSNIVVQDYRMSAAEAARRALSGIDDQNFADVFNCPAWVEILEEQGEITINIRDEQINGEDRSILWLGILYDQELKDSDMCWRFSQPITGSITAFAAIV